MRAPKIIFEDSEILVINKPAGVVVHPDDHHKKGTVVNWLLENYPDIKGVGEDSERPGIVHRLDKDTSGVLLITKTGNAFRHFKELFKERKIRKIYLALVVGSVRDDSGIIDEPLARSTKNFEKRVVGGEQGKSRDAVTEYKVRERFGNKFTLLEVSPKTGRTHQIRSHLAHIGYPIVCDELYAGKRNVCPTTLKRQFLHAFRLDFALPSGEHMTLEAPLPQDLEKTLKHCQSQ
ncbi:MAG: RluA family pseudouridine synthase [bacterium]|nr:RluA family pseudouridine synthase [bacterium]